MEKRTKGIPRQPFPQRQASFYFTFRSRNLPWENEPGYSSITRAFSLLGSLDLRGRPFNTLRVRTAGSLARSRKFSSSLFADETSRKTRIHFTRQKVVSTMQRLRRVYWTTSRVAAAATIELTVTRYSRRIVLRRDFIRLPDDQRGIHYKFNIIILFCYFDTGYGDNVALSVFQSSEHDYEPACLTLWRRFAVLDS